MAQSIYVYPITAIAPRGSYQTVTAIVTGVNDKTVTWSTSGGTLVGTNPCVVNEPCTIAVYDATAETDTLTATSNANGSVVKTATATFTASPVPVTTWPRMIYTQANLPSMRAKAVSGNVAYASMRAKAISFYNQFNPVFSWTCNSGTGLPSSDQTHYTYIESAAQHFAQMALLDPSDPTYNWGCYAHDTGIYILSAFPAAWGMAYNVKDGIPLWIFVDWLRGSQTLSSGDLATMRSGLTWLVQDAFATTGNIPNPASTYNSAAVLHTVTPTGDLDTLRSASGNNYNIGRFLAETIAGLEFNDNTTDAPLNPSGPLNTCGTTNRYVVCADGTAGSMIAYWKYLVGAHLYVYWGHIEDPNVVQQAYNAFYGSMPTMPQCEWYDASLHPCFGDGRGGGSAEGSFYKYSMQNTRQALNIMHSAGVDDPLLYGPQMSAGFSSFWDLLLVDDLSTLTYPVTENWPTPAAYEYISFGDVLNDWRYSADFNPDLELLTLDTMTGRTDRTNAIAWLTYNTAYGGPLGTSWGCHSYCGLDNELGFEAAIDPFDFFFDFGAIDPEVGTLPTDPRPSLPTDFYDGSFNQQNILRTSVGSNSSMVTWWMNNSGINHEYNVDGDFWVYGCLSATCDVISKGRNEFNSDYDVKMYSATNQNMLGIYNSLSLNPAYGFAIVNSYEMANGTATTMGGGQWPQGSAAGFVTSTHSELPTYAAVIGNITNAYNGTQATSYFSSATDVLAASRSIVYLRGTNQIAYFDRAQVGHPLSTQFVNQVTTGTPTVSGNTAWWLTRSSAQEAYFTSLLPSGGTITAATLTVPPGENAGQQATDWEPSSNLQVNPPGTPLSSQFLSVLEWGAAGFTKTSTTLVQSTAGQNFDGALVGSSLVMFMRAWPGTFTGVTYPASGATTHYLSDLTPNMSYAISGAGTPGTATTDTAGVLTFSATGTGNITVGAASGSGGTVYGGGVIISGGTVIQ